MAENYPSAAKRLGDLLHNYKKGEPAIALPGIHDALSAKIFASSGSKVLFLSGFGVSANRLGVPDAGILTRSEMEDTVRSIIAAIPRETVVIVDGDTGYGGSANVQRTIRGFASAGAAAVTIEDQKFPKKCTFVAGSGINVISREAAIARVRTALKARDQALEDDGNEILVIARTDCRMALGFDEAAERCRVFEDMGADIVYAENLQSIEEYRSLREMMKPSTPMMLAQVQLDQSQNNVLTTTDIGGLGYALGLYGVTALQATVNALQATAQQFLDESNGGVIPNDDGVRIASFEEVKKVVGFPELDEF
eukprot:CAMPEP_0195288768 /NCGR_PEP_ID=MMETSP0707-20130614/5298_1 /TAXON_ID=33640 /ORGANISM="Asterionellopsis glacialis, Strain CCMP134" /LENGTH=308 /DNA_ID=CAMNT_0040348669 /DNA_START=176 /DNA_END=1099 /DNA_ORIENTATION=+